MQKIDQLEMKIFKWNPKVIPRIRIFPDIGFSKGSDTQNHLYYNKNLFKSIDMMWVSFDENYFLDI